MDDAAVLTASAAPAPVEQAPGPEHARDAANLLELGRRLYAERRFEESEAAFREALGLGSHPVEALYGLGVVRLASGDPIAAEACFETILEQEPLHANALFYLGTLAEGRGFVDEARALYRRALASQPDHGGARAKLSSSVEPVPSASPASPASTDQAAPPPATDGRQGAIPAEYGVYEYLLQDSSPLSRQTVASLDALRLDGRPSMTAHLGRFMMPILTAGLVIWGGMAVVRWGLGRVAGLHAFFASLIDPSGRSAAQFGRGLADLERRIDGVPWEVGIALLCVLWLLMLYIGVRTARITIDKGRLQVEHGVLGRRRMNVELWRVQNVELRRTFLNRLTGDGSLILQLYNEPRRLKIVGAARSSRLDQVYQQLLNLVYLLRTNPLSKGIVL